MNVALYLKESLECHIHGFSRPVRATLPGTGMGPVWDPVWDRYGTGMGPVWDRYGLPGTGMGRMRALVP